MKQNFLIISFVLLVIGCTKESIGINDDNTNKDTATVTLLASIDESDTKVSIYDNGDNTFSHYWQEGDKIVVFDGNNSSAEFGLYEYDTSNPSNTAYFSGEFSSKITGAIYPYNNLNAAYFDNSFTVTFPSEQTYVAGSYDPASNVYVATCTNATLSFNSLMCYLRVALYSNTSNTAVSKIVISSVGGEKIAGRASVSADGEITMDNSAVSSITLSCTTPVVLSSDPSDPTYFYIAIPAVEVSGGLKVDVYNVDSHLWRNVSVPTDKRNKVFKMKALEYSPLANGSTAILESGANFNALLKFLSGQDTTSARGYYIQNQDITQIVFEHNKNMTGVTSGVEGEDYIKVSASGSTNDIIATYKDGIAKIQTAADTIKCQSCSYLFMNFRGVESISGLESLEIGDRSPYMNYMFYYDQALETIDLSDIALSNRGYAKYTSLMFYNCSSLTTIKFWDANFYTRQCNSMFDGCTSLTTINNLDLLYSSGSYLTSTERMFKGCSSLSELKLSSNFTAKSVTNMSRMFEGCDELEELDLRNFNTAAVKSMTYFCNSCSKLKTLDISGDNWSTESISVGDSLKNFICNDYSLETVKIGENFTFNGVTTIYQTFFSNPTNPSFNKTLSIWCSRETANNLLHKCARTVVGINNGKFIFKTIDGKTNWKYYVDEGLTTEITNVANVTNTSYVGLAQ